MHLYARVFGNMHCVTYTALWQLRAGFAIDISVTVEVVRLQSLITVKDTDSKVTYLSVYCICASLAVHQNE